MRTISVRQLLRDFPNQYKDLPVLVTQRGIPLCVITQPETSNGTKTKRLEIATEALDISQNKRHRCEYPNCSVYDTELYEVEIDLLPRDVYLCRKHANVNRGN